MTIRALGCAALLLAAAGVAAAAPKPPAKAAAPKAASVAETGPIPVGTLSGPGSISGVWTMTGYIGSRNPPRARIARDVNGQIPPMLPWAADLLEKRIVDAEHDKPFANTASRCLPEGVPYIMFSAVDGPIQILETPGQVTLLSEEMNEHWLIYVGGQHPAPGDVEPSFHGDSVAHWEGGVLVVDTVGLTTQTTLDQVGMPHSEALHTVTRIRRVDPQTLEFAVTIDDPKTFQRPWTRRVIYKKAKAGDRIFDDNCENSRNQPDAQGFQSFQFK